MSDPPIALPVVTALLVTYILSKWFNSTTYQLRHIPTIGSSGIISSYLNVFKFVHHGHEIIQEGYEKYRGTAFKVANMSKWLVIVSGSQMIDDIRHASDDQLSFEEAMNETIQTDYTFGREVRLDTYHVGVVQTPLTRNIAIRFDDLKDEIFCSFTDLIHVENNEWTTVPAFTTMMKVVCRASNRLFVGLPLCRDADYRELIEQFTVDVSMSAQFLNLFPKILRPIVGRCLTKVPANIKRVVTHVGPIIEYQLDKEEQYGKDWPGKPNTLISWLLDEAQGTRRTVKDLAIRILTINFGAIHSTTNALTVTLFNLAAYPEYVIPMREEVKAVIETEGWTKLAMGKMRKVDSFIKESQRLAIGALIVKRKVMKDFTFSSGLTLPAGTDLAVATYSTHMEGQNYDKPHEFQGFRFAELRDEEGEGIKHQFVYLTPDYLTFGTGRHACPGRFFAANELKAMVAYILLNYDVKLPNDGPRPKSSWSQGRTFPNKTAEIMFRKQGFKVGP